MEQQVQDHATRLARVEQRVEDISATVQAMAPLVAQQAETGVRIRNLDQDVQGVREELKSLRSELVARDEQVTQERRANRVALYALTGAIAAAIISGVAAVIASVIG